MNEEELPYDKPLEIETGKAYHAYTRYRDLGAARSIDKAYAEYLKQRGNGRETAAGKTAAPRHWQDWSSRNEWPRRAASYDAYLDEQDRAAAEADHLQELKDFRLRCLEEARRKGAAANSLLARMEQRMSKEDADPSEGTLAAIARAAALGEQALNQEAAALGLDDLLRRLSD